MTCADGIDGARSFVMDGKTLATLTSDGRIRLAGEAGPNLPQLGYAAALPSTRLLDALSALLVSDLSAHHRATTD